MPTQFLEPVRLPARAASGDGDRGVKREAKNRNAIEGTISEMVRGYGLRKTRYRGLAKTRLANYFIAAACNVRRWAQQIAWQRSLPKQKRLKRDEGGVLPGFSSNGARLWKYEQSCVTG